MPPAQVLDGGTRRALREGRHPRQADQPRSEPDRSVWRILSNARALGFEVSDEQIVAVLPSTSSDVAAIKAARARVEGCLYVFRPDDPNRRIDTTDDLIEELSEPHLTLDEAMALGFL